MASLPATSSSFDLPEVRGSYRFDYPLGSNTWFSAGGKAEVLFKPKDIGDLQYFIEHKSPNVPVTFIGVGSNTLIRDGGVAGVVVRLGKGFTDVKMEGNILTAGAAALDRNVALKAAECGFTGLEWMVGVPGTVGGAIKMNAGCYGSEVKDTLMDVTILTEQGDVKTLKNRECSFKYRSSAIPEGACVLEARFKLQQGNIADIAASMEAIVEEREAAQPTRGKTGGSTFKNPKGSKKAWELIDAAGCRGLTNGNAKISEKHCNFMVNHGGASAAELEDLGEQVRERVKAESGVDLEWEIQFLGKR